jgi:hypothetical protein
MLPPATAPFSAPLAPSLLSPLVSLSALSPRPIISLSTLSICCALSPHLLRPVRPSTAQEMNLTHALFAPRSALLSSPLLNSLLTTQLLRYPGTDRV